MKSLFKAIITKILVRKAKQYLAHHRTQVIAITGSIGKTSTKEAIRHILSKHFSVYASPQGFNTELGISLAILQEEKSGFSSPSAWLKILKNVFFKPKKPYQKIILEMGADKPGDIKKLIKIASPKIAVITNVNPVHLNDKQFKDLEDIREEKNSLIKTMGKDGVAILNYDNPLVRSMETPARKMSYGTQEGLDLQASNIQASGKHIRFDVTYKGATSPFKVPVLGRFQTSILLPAIAVGLKLGMDLKECAEALEDMKLPPSRMNPIPGVNKSNIIDSSYNASPIGMNKALEFLAELKANRKIAALGTMNELGELSKEAHLALGKQAAEAADVLVAVGNEASTIKNGAYQAGMPENRIFTFFDSEEAGYFLKDFIEEKDIVLAKGSQNKVRMERLVKVIMAQPEKAPGLLCRQDDAWEKI